MPDWLLNVLSLLSSNTEPSENSSSSLKPLSRPLIIEELVIVTPEPGIISAWAKASEFSCSVIIIAEASGLPSNKAKLEAAALILNIFLYPWKYLYSLLL